LTKPCVLSCSPFIDNLSNLSINKGNDSGILPFVKSLFVRAGVVIPARNLSWSSSRSSGPGGQNVNKVSSKVDLRFDVDQCSVLSPAVKQRLRARCRRRLDANGLLVLVSQATRDRERNLDDARERLAALIRAALVEPKTRKPTRPTRSSRERRLSDKKHTAERKRQRVSRDLD
jgi:ribosome-associated protein